MAKSQHDIKFRRVMVLLREMREKAGLTQRDLAALVRKPQSWVYKSETGIRRIDISEFLTWCLACKTDPRKAFDDLVQQRAR